jgi:hypothetical protein
MIAPSTGAPEVMRSYASAARSMGKRCDVSRSTGSFPERDEVEHRLHVALRRPADDAEGDSRRPRSRRTAGSPRPGPSDDDTVNSSSFKKKGGRGMLSPTTPTSTMRPRTRVTSAANSMGSLLCAAAVITTASTPCGPAKSRTSLARRAEAHRVGAEGLRELQLGRVDVGAEHPAALGLQQRHADLPDEPEADDQHPLAEGGPREAHALQADGRHRGVRGLLEGDVVGDTRRAAACSRSPRPRGALPRRRGRRA